MALLLLLKNILVYWFFGGTLLVDILETQIQNTANKY